MLPSVSIRDKERSVVERKALRFDSIRFPHELRWDGAKVSESRYGQAHKRVKGTTGLGYRGISGMKLWFGIAVSVEKRGGKVRDQHPLDSRGLQNSHTVNDSFRNITQIFLRRSCL